MTGLILVRHGETEWNTAEVFRGRIDIGLSETGRKQAGRLAGHLSSFEIEAIYSSPLQRAYQTAEAVAVPHNLAVTVAAGLMDCSFGEWQGQSRREVSQRYPDLFAEWLQNPHRVRPPGGETLDEVRQRAVALVDEVIVRHTGTVVLVSHRVVHKVLICALLGLDNARFWNVRLDTCGLTTFTREDDGRLVLVGHNDTCHLRPLGDARGADF
ncbi:MAG: histidine phosphatase family protein [Chloroflexota bacterium]